MEMQLLLQHLIYDDQCFFSLDRFNQLLAEYELGYMESSNRPSPIRRDAILSTFEHSLNQSG